MLKEPSIQEVMSQIAEHLETLQEDDLVERDFLSAIDVFVSIDPVLGALHKEYLDTRARSGGVARRFGADAPMAVVAADVAASAESAFQTRLIEVRRDPAMRRSVLKILRRQRARKRRAARRHKQHGSRRMLALHWRDDVRRSAESVVLPA